MLEHASGLPVPTIKCGSRIGVRLRRHIPSIRSNHRSHHESRLDETDYSKGFDLMGTTDQAIPKSDESTWPSALYELLKKNNIEQVAVVPDAGHSDLIKFCQADRDMNVVTLTTEEEGVGLLAGAWLGGKKGVLLLQSSGVGNCINMLSLPLAYSFPLLMIVTMRGDHGEFNPMQIPMGDSIESVLRAMGVICKRADKEGDVAETVSGALQLAFNGYRPVAALIGQPVMGAKVFDK